MHMQLRFQKLYKESFSHLIWFETNPYHLGAALYLHKAINGTYSKKDKNGGKTHKIH